MMAGAEVDELSVDFESRASDIRSYVFSLPDGDGLIALWSNGVPAEFDPGLPSTVTVHELGKRSVTEIDVLHGYLQPLKTEEQGPFGHPRPSDQGLSRPLAHRRTGRSAPRFVLPAHGFAWEHLAYGVCGVQLDPNGSVFVVGPGKAGVGTAGAAAEILGNQTEFHTWPAPRRRDPLSLPVCRPEWRRCGPNRKAGRPSRRSRRGTSTASSPSNQPPPPPPPPLLCAAGPPYWSDVEKRAKPVLS